MEQICRTLVYLLLVVLIHVAAAKSVGNVPKHHNGTLIPTAEPSERQHRPSKSGGSKDQVNSTPKEVGPVRNSTAKRSPGNSTGTLQNSLIVNSTTLPFSPEPSPSTEVSVPKPPLPEERAFPPSVRNPTVAGAGTPFGQAESNIPGTAMFNPLGFSGVPAVPNAPNGLGLNAGTPMNLMNLLPLLGGIGNAAGMGSGSVHNGQATATGTATANTPNGGYGIALGIGATISTPFGNFAVGNGQTFSMNLF